jgi:hypothetical protein
VRYSRIGKRAKHVHERIGGLVRDDVDQRLRAARSARRREVGKLDRCRHTLFRVVHGRQTIQPRIGHFRNANRHFGFALGRAPDLARARHELEQGGLAGGTEADESCSEHLSKPCIVTRELRRPSGRPSRSGPRRRQLGHSASSRYSKANILRKSLMH